MLDKYINEQDVVTRLLKNSLKENKIVQAYLFCCDDIEYIYKYSKEFAKEIIGLSNNSSHTLEKIYEKIDKNEYNELKIVIPQGNNIKKEQLLLLQNSVVNKPVEGNKMIYIIKNAEKLNSASANSILKFLEEPEDDIIAILLTDNINMIMPTIKSRCQVLNFKNIEKKEYEKNKVLNYLLNNDENYDETEIINIINNSIEVINNLELKKVNTFIYEKKLLWDKFKNNENIFIFFDIMIYMYMDSLHIKIEKKINYMNNYIENLDIIVDNNNKEQIIKKIGIIEKLKSQLKMNCNSKLIFDRMIMEFSEV